MTSIVDDLKAAAEDVKEAGLPESLQPAGFTIAFWSRRHAGSPLDKSNLQAAPEMDSDKMPEGQAAQIATRLKLEHHEVENVFDFSDGDLSLLVSPRFLDTGNRAGATQIAYLIAAGRQACGEEWTEAAAIREVVKERGRLDGNFNVVLGNLDGNGASVKGVGRDRKVKLNAVGIEKAAEIARALAAKAVTS
jgi:hypothetical protein